MRCLHPPAGKNIDGLQYPAERIQAPANAAALRLSIELVTDWRKFGTWTKTYEISMALK